MKCPFCKKTLVRGEKKRFENLSDHVENPNAENHPLRLTFVCDCEYSKDSFWDGQGGIYSGRNSYDHRELYRLFPSKNCHAAIDSWDEWMDNVFTFQRKIEPFMIFAKYKSSAAYRVAKFFFNPSKPKNNF